MTVTKQPLDPEPAARPHVLLLGAGASRAACPRGDANGRAVPLMRDLVEVLGLGPLLQEAGVSGAGTDDFESVYSQLAAKGPPAGLLAEIEQQIAAYFRDLRLPDHATLYDRLLLSLRPKDAVLTFNWDPFLLDAYDRNRAAAPLPALFFLHGNVRIGSCAGHGHWGPRGLHCPECGEAFVDVPLLYPVGDKDYWASPYIAQSWAAAQALLSEALTLTVFGYAAPVSDHGAVTLLQNAWFGRSGRQFEHVEVIDTADPGHVAAQWRTFTPTHHLRHLTDLRDSRLTRWPRRTCEELALSMARGVPSWLCPLPWTSDLGELQAAAAELARGEISGSGTAE
jgi:hypothetical protein